MKVIAVILLGHLALYSSAFPLDSAPALAKTTNIRTKDSSSASASASARVERGAFSKSGSEVGPDGRLKSAAIAAKTGDGPMGGVGSNVGGGSTGSECNGCIGGSSTSAPSVTPLPDNNNNNNNNGPATTLGPMLPVQGPMVPVRGPVKSFQKVNAVASKDTGTAIASAINKRQMTNVQKAGASGNVAIAKTKTSQGQGASFQASKAEGEKLAVATAENNGRVSRQATKNIQVVQASGNKALSSASETKGSALNFQHVQASGGDLAVAKATSGFVADA